ncbi:ImmA/IrrE family metallo-endopeptidase [Sphingopyxis indica]|uniref:ImmA/IrrE family metallo-endopeptidase n=1 Tax=Sphingopyxis indica TaxID=436663 RepID=UPI0029391531|nr:ImmA/IrrE family metallo-endopeptidase [Sphingopyxis indica]WOF41720.1 ImmA/IrrE family metallo-endopeptidase [Sphingopyxis indica]
MTKDPARPGAWANLLSQAWGSRFPVDVKAIALEYSTRFPDPIKTIAKADVATFEGALCPLPKSGKWAILYNPGISSPGRINFTLAHEFGHYLCHRSLRPLGFECGEESIYGVGNDDDERRIEQEADTFASYLLMPIDDYRDQVGRGTMCLDLLAHAANRYAVSSTAAAIKWLDFTSEPAALVVATNGFILWCWRSKAAKRRGIYFERGTPLPAKSWAANPTRVAGANGIELPRNVWSPRSEAREMAIFADRYEMTISLVVFGEEVWNSNTWQSERS